MQSFIFERSWCRCLLIGMILNATLSMFAGSDDYAISAKSAQRTVLSLANCRTKARMIADIAGQVLIDPQAGFPANPDQQDSLRIGQPQ